MKQLAELSQAVGVWYAEPVEEGNARIQLAIAAALERIAAALEAANNREAERESDHQAAIERAEIMKDRATLRALDAR